VVVEYAQDILDDTPDVHFFQADFRQPEELLNRSKVRSIVGDERNVALVSWGIGNFMTDEELSYAAKALYDWAGPESCWAFQAQGAGANPDDPSLIEFLKIYEKMGKPLHIRSLEAYRNLVQPWHADEDGFVSLLKWHGFDQDMMSEEELAVHGAGGGAGYGAYLVK
jgi:hypothetical protein